MKRPRTQKAHKRSPSASQRDVPDLQSALDEAFPDQRWLAVLELFAHTGVADARQICTTTGLSRDQLDTLLRRFHELAGQDILARVSGNIPRPGTRGRPPAVYTLGKTGAALLRANGHPNAHACGLDDAWPIAHARATLDVRLAADRDGLPAHTERELPYTINGEEKTLRPDNLITLPDGSQALFETEQAASIALLQRITAALRRKAAFFQAPEGKRVSPTVRVLINLPFGPAWDKTVHVWERATAIVAEKHGGRLPFRILAMPLLKFLANPDWSEPPDPDRWESLFDPARTAAFGPVQPQTQRAKKKAGPPAQRAKLPRTLKRRSPADDRRILQAYWQHLLEHGPELAYTADTARPDPAFFEVMRVIYVASHPPDALPHQQATHPYASLFLLRKYLDMHPNLRQAISKAMDRDKGTMRWNVTTIQHRMQVVIHTFLRYHGWRVSRAMEAVPVSSWNRTDGLGDFGVAVRIRAPELLMGEDDGIVPGKGEVQAAEQALAWVLWALFAYAEDLGIKRPNFW